MEEEQKRQPVEVVENPTMGVGLRPPRPIKKENKIKKILPLIVALIFLVGGFLVLRGGSTKTPDATPTPFDQDLVTPFPTETPEPVDKSEIEIEIFNGTGIAKEASYLQGKLRDLGFTQIETGNAEDQDQIVTKVTFSSSVPEAIVDEITEELEDIYEDVETSTSGSLDVDVQIVTGLREGATPIPSPSPTTDEESPTPTPTESPTPT
ncbi:MAG: LytR C-terminal domain-containing protein, partial [Microgenomates group bacterium]